MSDEILFSPIELGPHTLKNRMVMAPLTRNRATRDECPHDLTVTYYSQRATAGLIVTEGAQISPQGLGYPFTPGIYNDQQVAAWTKVTDAVHAKGGRIFVQLWHVGRISHPSLQKFDETPVAPSAIKPAGEAVTYEGMQPYVTPRALELDELKEIVDDYQNAAECAMAAGFDGVEIHAANGYLIDQFLRDGSNQRDDKYGGEIENRFRFLQKVLKSVTDVCGSERVGVRISPTNPFNDMSDSDPQALFNYVAKKLSKWGLAYLHVVEGAIGPDDNPTEFDYQALRQQYKGLYIANAGYDRTRAIEALNNKHADLVSFGVPFIANPDLVERFQQNAPLNEADQQTFYGGDEHGYTDYPTLAQNTNK